MSTDNRKLQFYYTLLPLNGYSALQVVQTTENYCHIKLSQNTTKSSYCIVRSKDDIKLLSYLALTITAYVIV